MSFFCLAASVLALALPSCESQQVSSIPGYVEGDYVTVVPIAQGLIRHVAVRDGDMVKPGTLLVELDRVDTQLAVSQAEAALREAEATLSDLEKGRRPAELAVLQAGVDTMEAELRNAALERDRHAALFGRKVISEAQNQTYDVAYQTAESKLAEAKAQLAVALLPARADALTAQRDRIASAKAALMLAQWNDGQRSIVARVSGRVDDVVLREGELASPLSPVMSILPNGGAIVKFFVSEAERSQYRMGATVGVTCSGCPAGLTARISRASDAPEFTPPVIYSTDRRQSLVYRIEARPAASGDYLQPGQIVSITGVQP